MSAQAFTIGTSAALTANAFSFSGSMFTGWNTAANGSGTPYEDKSSATFSNAVTLYAQWVTVPDGSAGVVFMSNGGSGTMTAQVSSPDTALKANTFTRAGYVLSSWNTYMHSGRSTITQSPLMATALHLGRWQHRQQIFLLL
jgi:hypothetical protein